MSALEIIEQIKSLPAAEWRKVANFVRELETEAAASLGDVRVQEASPGIRYATSEAFEKSMERVLAEHDELFRRLAQ